MDMARPFLAECATRAPNLTPLGPPTPAHCVVAQRTATQAVSPRRAGSRGPNGVWRDGRGGKTRAAWAQALASGFGRGPAPARCSGSYGSLVTQEWCATNGRARATNNNIIG